MVTAEYICDEFIAEDDLKAFEEFFNTYKEQTKGVRIEYLMHDIDFKTAVRNMHSIASSMVKLKGDDDNILGEIIFNYGNIPENEPDKIKITCLFNLDEKE